VSYMAKFAKLVGFLASWLVTVGTDALYDAWDTPRHTLFQAWVQGPGLGTLKEFLRELLGTELGEQQNAALTKLVESCVSASNKATTQLALGSDIYEVASVFRTDAMLAGMVFVADVLPTD